MFTGIVERVSKVVEINTIVGGMRLKVFSEAVSSTSGILAPWQDLATGESISVDGVCLSLIETGDFLAFDVIEESLRRTSLGDLQCGDLVNLERSLKIGDRLGGHYVTGHIDTRGRVTAQEGDDDVPPWHKPIRGEDWKTAEWWRGSERMDAMLSKLGIRRVELLTNNPLKIAYLRACGVEVAGRSPVLGTVTPENEGYLRTKAKRAGHMMDVDRLMAGVK